MDASVNIDVPDLERAVRFYEEGIGLRLKRRLFGSTVAEMIGAPIAIYLLAKRDAAAPTAQSGLRRSYERHWTPVHLDFIVEDLQASIRKAQHAGARLEGAARSFPWGSIATLSDPFGHGLCLIQWSGKGYDEAS